MTTTRDQTAAGTRRPSWFATIGFATLSSIAVLALSGIGLAFHYVPSTDLAYDSIRALEQDQSDGAFLRSLHVYGATLAIALALAALLRTFLAGAYKKPHRTTWVTGVLALLVLIAIGVTGELLPWSEQAVMATEVRTEVLGLTPGIGAALREAALGGETVAAPTLTRFYVLHVVVLPAALLLLLVLHLRGVCRRGLTVAEDTDYSPVQTAPWDARQFLRQSLVALVCGLGLIGFAWEQSAPLGAVYAPGDQEFEATPEWHFLWLNMLLRLFPGSLAFLPGFVIPSLLLLLALLLPWVDRNPERRLGRRKLVLSLAGVLVLALGGLSAAGAMERPENRAVPDYPLSLDDGERRGYLLVRREACMECHAYGEFGETDYDAPDLDEVTPDLDEIVDVLKDPLDVLGTEDMPSYGHLPAEDLRAMARYLLSLQE